MTKDEEFKDEEFQKNNPLLPCPFCGDPVALEEARTEYDSFFGPRRFFGVVCRSVKNHSGSCCMQQVPSASRKAAIKRWNMRNGQTQDV